MSSYASAIALAGSTAVSTVSITHLNLSDITGAFNATVVQLNSTLDVCTSANESVNSIVGVTNTTDDLLHSTVFSSLALGSLETDYLFTDLIETDAFHIGNFHEDTDWSIQNYAVSASSARGPFG